MDRGGGSRPPFDGARGPRREGLREQIVWPETERAGSSSTVGSPRSITNRDASPRASRPSSKPQDPGRCPSQTIVLRRERERLSADGRQTRWPASSVLERLGHGLLALDDEDSSLSRFTRPPAAPPRPGSRISETSRSSSPCRNVKTAHPLDARRQKETEHGRRRGLRGSTTTHRRDFDVRPRTTVNTASVPRAARRRAGRRKRRRGSSSLERARKRTIDEESPPVLDRGDHVGPPGPEVFDGRAISRREQEIGATGTERVVEQSGARARAGRSRRAPRAATLRRSPARSSAARSPSTRAAPPAARGRRWRLPETSGLPREYGVVFDRGASGGKPSR
jgi:hypothetical protein